MNDDPSYGQRGRALFLAAIMVLSVVTISAAFAGSAVADSPPGEIDDRVVPETAEVGENVTVTTNVTIHEDIEAFGLVDEFDPVLENNATVVETTIDDTTEYPNLALADGERVDVVYNNTDENNVAIASGSTVSITYELQLPDEPGELTISGNVTVTAVDGEVETLEYDDSTITVEDTVGDYPVDEDVYYAIASLGGMDDDQVQSIDVAIAYDQLITDEDNEIDGVTFSSLDIAILYDEVTS